MIRRLKNKKCISHHTNVTENCTPSANSTVGVLYSVQCWTLSGTGGTSWPVPGRLVQKLVQQVAVLYLGHLLQPADGQLTGGSRHAGPRAPGRSHHLQHITLFAFLYIFIIEEIRDRMENKGRQF